MPEFYHRHRIVNVFTVSLFRSRYLHF